MFEDAIRQLDQLAKNAEALDGTHEVPASELFPPVFMARHSSYPTFQAMYEASPYRDMDFEKIPDAEWDEYISKSTKFASWAKMREVGVEEWAEARLMKGAEGFDDLITIEAKI
jgi:hypothetical protein